MERAIGIDLGSTLRGEIPEHALLLVIGADLGNTLRGNVLTPEHAVVLDIGTDLGRMFRGDATTPEHALLLLMGTDVSCGAAEIDSCGNCCSLEVISVRESCPWEMGTYEDWPLPLVF